MVPQHAIVAVLSLAATARAQFGQATSTSAFWTYTSRLAALATPSVYTSRNGGVSTFTYTDIHTVKPSVTPTASPTSTRTYTGSYDDLELVYAYYGVGAVAESDLVPEYDYSYTRTSTVTTSIVFSMPVTMTAPTYCPTPFTVTTTATVSVPSQVWDQIKPTSTINPGVSTRYGYYGYQYSIQTWYLSAGAAPFTSTDYMYYNYYVASCSTLPPSRSTRTRTGASTTSTGDDFVSDSGGSSNSDNDGNYCYRYSYYCGTPLRTWIIVIATVVPALFLLGFLESWFWFRRLMTGKSAMRFGTICWVLISLWILCFTRMQDARSKEDHVLLEEKWKNMGSGAAFKAWLKWSFRHAYPVEHLGQFSRQTVGVVPSGEPLHPSMAQAHSMGAPGAPGQHGQVYYYGPPPPGWVPTPDGQGFMPPQGYVHPPPQQAGFYASDVSKDRTTVTSSPVSALGPHPAMVQESQANSVSPMAQHAQAYPVSPMAPTPPQPVHPAPAATHMQAPNPPPKGPVPAIPPPQAAPPAPPANVSEVPATSRNASAGVNEAPAHPVQPPTGTGAPQLPPLAKSDPNNRDLYD